MPRHQTRSQAMLQREPPARHAARVGLRGKTAGVFPRYAECSAQSRSRHTRSRRSSCVNTCCLHPIGQGRHAYIPHHHQAELQQAGANGLRSQRQVQRAWRECECERDGEQQQQQQQQQRRRQHLPANACKAPRCRARRREICSKNKRKSHVTRGCCRSSCS